MKPKEIRDKIANITANVVNLRILEKAVPVAKLVVPEEREGSDYTTFTYRFDHRPLNIVLSSYRYGPEYILINWQGTLVFSADFREDSSGSFTDIRVKIFAPGNWIDSLDAAEWSRKLCIKRKEESEAKEVADREAFDNRPLSKAEEAQAVSLGLMAAR